MSDSSPIRIPFTSSPSPSPPPDSHAHENEAHEGHSRSLPLPSSHLPPHAALTPSKSLPVSSLPYPMAANAPQQRVPAPDFPTYYPPLPSDHPPLPPHAHADNSKKCPFAAKHEFCPPQEGDVRSPCPALNTMANHGYINRSGKNLTAAALTSALQKCYNLSLPLAVVLSYGGFILLHRYNFLRGIDLKEVGKHGYVEHDASLVHRDTILGDGENDNQNANGRTLAETTPSKSATNPKPRSPIKRLTASLSLPALPLPLKKEKKPVYYAPTEIVPEWVDALMLDARMLREDDEWAFKIMARDQQEFALSQAKEKSEKEGEKGEGRKLGHVPQRLNLNGTADATPTNTPAAPVIEPSPSGDGYDVTLGSSSSHTRGPTTASDATTSSSLSSSAHSAFFSPTSAGSTSTAQTTPAQTPHSSKFSTLALGSGSGFGNGNGNGNGIVLSSLRFEEHLGGAGAGGNTMVVDEHDVVASPTTITHLPPLPLPTSNTNANTNTLPTSTTNTNAITPPESSTHRTLLTAASVSLSRIRREAHSLAHSTLTRAGGAGRTGTDGQVQGIDAVHAEIARGEMAIVLGMWEVEDYPGVRKEARAASLGGASGEGEGERFPGVGRAVGEGVSVSKKGSLFKRFSTSSSFSSITHSKSSPSIPSTSTPSRNITSSSPSTPANTTPQPVRGIPAEWFREWITYERLPGGWRPMRTQGLLDTMKRSREVKQGMERFRAEFAARAGAGVNGGVSESGGVSVSGVNGGVRASVGGEMKEARSGMEAKRESATMSGSGVLGSAPVAVAEKEVKLREEF